MACSTGDSGDLLGAALGDDAPLVFDGQGRAGACVPSLVRWTLSVARPVMEALACEGMVSMWRLSARIGGMQLVDGSTEVFLI